MHSQKLQKRLLLLSKYKSKHSSAISHSKRKDFEDSCVTCDIPWKKKLSGLVFLASFQDNYLINTSSSWQLFSPNISVYLIYLYIHKWAVGGTKRSEISTKKMCNYFVIYTAFIKFTYKGVTFKPEFAFRHYWCISPCDWGIGT